MKAMPVGVLVARIKAFLETRIHLDGVLISGELSNIRQVNGHYYFNLKDANGQLVCNMWKSVAMRLSFQPKDGMQVEVTGRISLYEKRGDLRLNVDSMALAGVGALFEELERRKKLLEAQGYFNPAHKKLKPKEINSIGIVTGASTAALQDVMKTIRERWPWLKVTLHPASVQGEQAPPTIVKALKQADKKGYDAILLVRGGGSIEDLFCFNDPNIVKTLYDMDTYVVTGIGHEIDTTLADLAADHRAVTPTAAAQWVTLDAKDEEARLMNLDNLLINRMRQLLSNGQQRFLYLQNNPYLSNPRSWLVSRQSDYERLFERLIKQAKTITEESESLLSNANDRLEAAALAAVNRPKAGLARLNEALYINSPKGRILNARSHSEHLEQLLILGMKNLNGIHTNELVKLSALLQALSPQSVLDRGFAIVTMNDEPVTSAKNLKAGDAIEAVFKDGMIHAEVK